MTPPRTEELLATYAAGGELSEQERASVEALLDQSPAARRELDDIGALLGDLRAIAPEPPPASEAVVRAVRIACAAPVPWTTRAAGWLRRRWRIALPVVLAAGAAAAIAIKLSSPDDPARPAPAHAPLAATSPDDEVVTPPASAVPSELWLDGEAIDLDDGATARLDHDLAEEIAAFDGGDNPDDDGFDGMLPDDDLDWVDQLDDSTADALDTWLAQEPS